MEEQQGLGAPCTQRDRPVLPVGGGDCRPRSALAQVLVDPSELTPGGAVGQDGSFRSGVTQDVSYRLETHLGPGLRRLQVVEVGRGDSLLVGGD